MYSTKLSAKKQNLIPETIMAEIIKTVKPNVTDVVTKQKIVKFPSTKIPVN